MGENFGFLKLRVASAAIRARSRGYRSSSGALF
jgi:hypothetical protein